MRQKASIGPRVPTFSIIMPFSLPIVWPQPTQLRYGAPAMLRGVPIFYDFDWRQQFGHIKSVFPNCKSIARKISAMTPAGKGPILLLTNRADVTHYRLDDSPERYVVHIFNASTVCSVTADVADTLLGRTAADSDIVAVLQRLRASPESFHRFLHQELTPEVVFAWAGADQGRIAALLEGLSALTESTPDVASIGLDLISALGPNTEHLHAFARVAERPVLRLASAAVKYAEQYLAAQEFATLVSQHFPEGVYQRFLEEHAWIFGTHYVGRWPGRQICVGDQQDFILQSADGFYDIIELKRPTHDVLRWDEAHDDFYPGPELSQAIGQVQHYLRNIDQELPAIVLRHGIHPYRARGIIVIGRLGSGDAEQRSALRGFNSHLSRIQVLTYTDLLTMAELIVDEARQRLGATLPGMPAAERAPGYSVS